MVDRDRMVARCAQRREHLRAPACVEAGAEERCGWRRTARHDKQIEHELSLIGKLGLAGYFLVVWDIVEFCNRANIFCQGRGSAANSAACYALGITKDPSQIPAFLVAVASAVIITRSTSRTNLSEEFVSQLACRPVVLLTTAAFLGLLMLGVLAVFAAPKILNTSDFSARGFHDETIFKPMLSRKCVVLSQCAFYFVRSSRKKR
jgi:hypothetical protein